ncbi:MAG: hypothetical protein IPL11_19545 [Candidatus Accumulibacter sp.]|nr:hypothetical protein [Accumulibacter sp.]
MLAPVLGAGVQSRGPAGTPWPRECRRSTRLPFHRCAPDVRHPRNRCRRQQPEPGRRYLRDTFGQGYWGKREGFIALLEWLAALANAEGMNEWTADSEAARILAGRLRNDHA